MKSEAINPLLIRKYDQPVPRYTSYPTVPYWKEEIDIKAWEKNFSTQFHKENPQNGISLYIHLPFCESLCTYCGCNKKITTNHNVEEQYIEAIEKEWKLYRKMMQQTPVFRELHLGGGTPTFFSPNNLQRLFNSILKGSIIHPQHSFSIEGHPNNTTSAHLQVLYKNGFRRISYGVQDMDPEVQRVINRIQPFENVKRATDTARKIGFSSVNFDLIYGLPLQTLVSIERTIKEVLTLRPDRIAFYSYAHVPWTSRAQRLFDESHLPSAEEKIQLYMKGKELLMEAGYVDIGMDHFALLEDELYLASSEGKLHRNFMGYTTQNTGFLLGLGVSSISDTGTAYGQNHKTLHEYYEAMAAGSLAIKKGYFLSDEDLAFKKYILAASCKGSVQFMPEHLSLLNEYSFKQLELLEKDGLVGYNKEGLSISEIGHFFIRNICSAFDLYLQRSRDMDAVKPIFSKAI